MSEPHLCCQHCDLCEQERLQRLDSRRPGPGTLPPLPHSHHHITPWRRKVGGCAPGRSGEGPQSRGAGGCSPFAGTAAEREGLPRRRRGGRRGRRLRTRRRGRSSTRGVRRRGAGLPSPGSRADARRSPSVRRAGPGHQRAAREREWLGARLAVTPGPARGRRRQRQEQKRARGAAGFPRTAAEGSAGRSPRWRSWSPSPFSLTGLRHTRGCRLQEGDERPAEGTAEKQRRWRGRAPAASSGPWPTSASVPTSHAFREALLGELPVAVGCGEVAAAQRSAFRGSERPGGRQVCCPGAGGARSSGAGLGARRSVRVPLPTDRSGRGLFRMCDTCAHRPVQGGGRPTPSSSLAALKRIQGTKSRTGETQDSGVGACAGGFVGLQGWSLGVPASRAVFRGLRIVGDGALAWRLTGETPASRPCPARAPRGGLWPQFAQ
ncbi:uncharacterized protein [Oryctolagus cuniculus]|uniref:uncharacterized protein n=1 Tax=Oryctolagus cuniculus TaxID=9986 RepID=UPI0038799AAF